MEPRPLPHRRPAGPSLLLAVLGAVACTEPEPVPTAIDLSGSSGPVTTGSTIPFTAAVSGDGGPIPNAKITWESRDTSSVRIDAMGVATALRPGESWVVATAGSVKDSALVEVTFLIAQGEGRARIRAGGKDVSVAMVDPYGVQLDILSSMDQSIWGVFGLNAAEDTIVAAYFGSAPSGLKTMLQEVAPDANPTDPSRPYAYLEINVGSTYRDLALRGWIDAGVDQNVPAGFRAGRMHMRMIGSGRFYTGTVTSGGGVNWTLTQDTGYVVSDMLPDFYHDVIGSSWGGQLTGTPGTPTWQLRSATWARTTARGRRYLLTVPGTPSFQLYLPGTASVDLGTEAETSRAFLVVSATGYAGTATSGRVEVTTYRAPPAVDLFGEIRGRVTFSGTGTTTGGAPAPFSGSFDFAVPVTSATQQAAPPALQRAAPMVQRMREHLLRR
jgi:hypothetical protein